MLRSKHQSLLKCRYLLFMKPYIHIFSFSASLLFANIVQAQGTKVNTDPDENFKQAKEYWQKGQYQLAFSVFKDLYQHPQYTYYTAFSGSEIKYYYLLSALQVNQDGADAAARLFIETEPDLVRTQLLSYHLAEYCVRKKDLANALTYYNKTDIAQLTNTEIANMKFHKGYVLFTMQRFDEALPLLDEVRQLVKDSNYADANYYYGFIVFNQKKYEQALLSFQIAEKKNEYKQIVPFYIAEIYYFSGEHNKALQYAEQKIREGGQYYELQLKQLAGHLWFDKKEYAKAYPYLQEYVKKSDKVKREELYELSYCYYAAGNWQESINGFKQLGGKEDSLAQNSMYLLADAYLKTNDKANARNAFLFCANNNSNALQKEASSFNYAKLSYELGYTDIALRELQKFIQNYPSSSSLQEAKELSISVLTNTSNYKDALVLFEALPTKSDAIKKIYPRILYGRAVEFINDQRLDKAEELLDKLIAAPYNERLIQLAYFWKGEIAYRNGNTDEAIQYLVNYLKSPLINGEVNATNAKYTLAYALLKKEQYANALPYFQQVAPVINSYASNIEQDAYTRSADCYFMQKNFKQSLQMYNNIIAANAKSSDYALYQKAIIAGATGKLNDKIVQLQDLIRLYPSSSLVPDANMEIANTYMANENFAEAINPLQQIINNKNATVWHPKAYLKSGVAYFNMDKNSDALSNFTKLVSTYPNSPESDEAIEYIRNIFIEQQQPTAFINFMKQNGKPVSYSEGDSLTYKSAQLKYESKDYNNALNGYLEYIQEYPEGKYAVEANYFTAEIYLFNKKPETALEYYKAVAQKSPNKYAERSALQAARIYYFDKKDYTNAILYYQQLKLVATQQENRLEAMRGLLRCQYKSQQWKDALANAQELLQEKAAATDDKMMANMIVAKSAQLDNQADAAINAYKQVCLLGKSEFSAEAQYTIAYILLQQNKLADAEKAGFETIKKYGSYDIWVTRSYLLLGDVYFKEKDWFNAEATYKSVADNASNAELKKEAVDKLAQTLNEKNKTEKVEQ